MSEVIDHSQAAIGIDHLDKSERHRLLAAERRRQALDILTGRSKPIGLTELASEIARRDSTIDHDDTETIALVETSLHHVHLPLLAASSLISYDPRTNEIDPPNSQQSP